MDSTNAARESTVQFTNGRGWCIGLAHEVEVMGPVYGPHPEGVEPGGSPDAFLLTITFDVDGEERILNRADVVPAFPVGSLIRVGAQGRIGHVVARDVSYLRVRLGGDSITQSIAWLEVDSFMARGQLMEGSGLPPEADALILSSMAQTQSAQRASVEASQAYDAIRDELSGFRKTVATTALKYGREHSMCSVVKDYLTELELEAPEMTYVVRVALEVDVIFEAAPYSTRDDSDWQTRAEYVIDGIAYSGENDDDGNVTVSIVSKSSGEVKPYEA